MDAEQGFELDYYDMHWVPRDVALQNDLIWRANLFGGGRMLPFVDRLRRVRNLGQYAKDQQWDCGEGFITGARGISGSAGHIVGKPYLPSVALGPNGIDATAIATAGKGPYERPRSRARFTPPMLLIREHMDIPHGLWTGHYLTYSKRIVGFPAPASDAGKLQAIHEWLNRTRDILSKTPPISGPLA